MKRKTSVFTLVILFITVSTVYAAPTTAVLDGGICINEILIDPNGTDNFDTDGDGTARTEDEFVELYNLSGGTIDISGWELWDAGVGNWFTFPGAADSGTTMLAAGAYAFVIADVQTGGSLPTMTNPSSLAFDANRGASGAMNNGGDNVVLYDPGADEYIQLRYNGDTEDNPPSSYTGFSATASRVGSTEDWGSDQDGHSLSRYPSGDTAVGVHDVIVPGGANASPTAITLSSLTAHAAAPWTGIALAGLLLGALVLVRRKR